MENINISFDLKGLGQTKKLAEKLADILSVGDSVLLSGNLGAGKTTFSQFLINALSKTEVEVVSPTFTLVQSYDTEQGEVNHLDLYRLEHENDLIELGWDEMVQSSITLVEWPDRLGGFLPENRLEITLNFGTENDHRHVNIMCTGSAWLPRAIQIQGCKI